MKGKRSGIDFSNHMLYTWTEPCTKTYDLKLPNTITNRITYICTNGITAVTGDYGNWIFCCEFHPSKDGKACEGYWAEKLQIGSTQDPMKFSETEAHGQIDALLADPNNEFSEEEKEWLEELRESSKDGEYAYIATAMEHPSSFPAEIIPTGKVYDIWFLTILDGFDEMCRHMGEPPVEKEKEPCDHKHTTIENMTSGEICEDCGEEI